MSDYRTNNPAIIYQLESSGGKDPRRLVQNKYKALGSYQLTPGALESAGKINPRWRKANFQTVALDDTLAAEAAGDYLTWLSLRLEKLGIPLNNMNLLASYHSGPGNVLKLGPEGKKYVARARALAGVQPGMVW